MSGKYHPVSTSIEALLRERGFWYERFEHEPVRTSEEAAAIRPTYTLREGAKALLVRVKKKGERRFVMLVVPGDRRFDPAKARIMLGASDIRFATESEVSKITDGVLSGGVPPFGNLFGLSVYADKHIFEGDRIIFNAGDRHVSIGMKSADYQTLVNPVVSDFV